MSQRHSPTTATADTAAASFLYASGLPLLRIDAREPRALFIFADRQERGAALRAAFSADAPIAARSLLRARHRLVTGIRLARAAPTRCCTGSELTQYWADVDAANRARWDRAG